MIHNFESMFDRMKTLTIELDTSLPPAERVRFFDDKERLRNWLRHTEQWCRESLAGDFDLGEHDALYKVWLEGQMALIEWTVPVPLPRYAAHP